jgi:protein disulfide-isomerase A1
MSKNFYSSNYFVSAKMEAQDNDLPPSISFRISGFPTLKFKRAGSRDFIDYEGDRSFESLISFIEEHAKNSLVLPETVEPKTEEPKTEEPKTEEPKTEEPKTDEAQVPLEVEKEEKIVAHEEL